LTKKLDIAPQADAVVDRMIDLTLSAGNVENLTDKYFSHTRRIAEANGDCDVTYAVFMRRRLIAAFEPAVRLISRLAPEANVRRFFAEGETVPSEAKLMEVRGKFSQLAELETLLLQKVGLPCVAANNAYEMCRAMPSSSFMDMHARHGAGPEMNMLAAYGASVGSAAARRDNSEVTGFTGSSQDITAPLFGAERGIGTMPHALIGLTGGDVLEAMKLFVAAVPDAVMNVALVDFAGHEVSDSLACAKWFYDDARLDKQGKLFGVRLDTHGGRFAEGLDYDKSVQIVGDWLGVHGEYTIVEQVLGLRAFQLDTSNILVDRVRRILFGAGVSVANIVNTRRALDNAGYQDAKIVASSGFGVQKCQVMGAANAPVDMVGTGSFLPATLAETYATADIIMYNGKKLVKVGREFLFD
jgi:nicotinate phosphoribosyltransferase